MLDELNKETPRLDYLRGMLETMIESEPDAPLSVDAPKAISSSPYVVTNVGNSPTVPADEASILDKMAATAMKKMPPLQSE